jgi:hypothetical protein
MESDPAIVLRAEAHRRGIDPIDDEEIRRHYGLKETSVPGQSITPTPAITTI